MDSEQQILAALRECVPGTDRLVVVHSSLFHLRPPSTVGRWHWLRALQALVDAGTTLALPTFTFSFCQGRPFHHRDSASETGVLGGWALTLRAFRRTRHPIYSFAVAGPLAEEILAAPSRTTFGPDSPFGVFERHDARIVMLGCDWSYCTQFHCSEEAAQVPYRYYKRFRGAADFGEGSTDAEATMFVRDLDADVRNDFGPVVSSLRERGAIRTAPLWGGVVESASAGAIGEVARELLGRDAWSLVSEPEPARYRLAAARTAREADPLRVALLGSANLELVREAVLEEAARLLPDRRLEVFTPGFDQVAQEVLTPGSALSRFRPELTVFADRLEDLAGLPLPELGDAERVEARVERYLDLVRRYREQAQGWIAVHLFSEMNPSLLGLGNVESESSGAALVRRCNRLLREGVKGLDGVLLLDLRQLAAGFGEGAVHDRRLWFLGRFPFSRAFSSHLARRIVGLLLAATGRTARLVVLDLDNTLWGGVLGEDGRAGIQVGGDYPGNAFRAFQEGLKRLSERGIALAVASKNDEPHAMEVLRTHPGMALTPESLVAWRIDWRPKWQNIVEIAEELNLGLENVLFIDDNPVEREQVRRRLPGVKVLELPQDPAGYLDALLSSPWIESLALTAEDRARTSTYQARRKVREQQGGFEDVEQFYASLGSRVTVAPACDENIARAVQLINKTNQFNATTRRYDRREVERMAESGASVFVIGAEDRFSPFENVGVLIVRWDDPARGEATIDSYLLSCRILGRGIETAVIYWLMDHARSRGMRRLRGTIVETERNTPVRTLYRDAGFVADGAPGEWRFELGEDRSRVPAWLTIVHRESPEPVVSR